MNLISSLSSVSAAPLRPNAAPAPAVDRELRGLTSKPGAGQTGEAFGSVFERMIGDVETKQAEAAAVTREVLMGDNPNLHQSVIAMQEASLSFSLMVEVRNKVLESYQELMRMPV